MQISDESIIQTMQTQPEQGFRMLMQRYREPVYWHIRRLVVAHQDAQDAAQETFVRVFRSWNQYRGDSALRSWIYSIATREALRLIERRREALSIDDGTAAEVMSLRADNYVDYSNAEAVRLQQAILSLPTKQQLAFNLRYYDEMSFDEIAQATGSKATAVKANYHLAKEKITKYMLNE